MCQYFSEILGNWLVLEYFAHLQLKELTMRVGVSELSKSFHAVPKEEQESLMNDPFFEKERAKSRSKEEIIHLK